jgi:hypothetical protein
MHETLAIIRQRFVKGLRESRYEFIEFDSALTSSHSTEPVPWPKHEKRPQVRARDISDELESISRFSERRPPLVSNARQSNKLFVVLGSVSIFSKQWLASEGLSSLALAPIRVLVGWEGRDVLQFFAGRLCVATTSLRTKADALSLFAAPRVCPALVSEQQISGCITGGRAWQGCGFNQGIRRRSHRTRARQCNVE